MNDINIFLCRHGESKGNVTATKNNTIGQDPNCELTDLGVEQAKKLANRFKGKEFNYIFSSTYRRAADTAICLFKETKIPVIHTESLVEYSPGDWKGKERSAIYEDFNCFKDLMYKNMGFLFPNGESLTQVERRASQFLEDNIIYNRKVLAQAKNKEVNVAVFSHGITIRCLLHYILGFNDSMVWKIRIDNASISHVVFNDRGFFINNINDIGHLKD